MIRVQFDGDLYDMTVPSLDIFMGIMAAASEKKITLAPNWYQDFLIQTDIYGNKAVLSSDSALKEDDVLKDSLMYIMGGHGNASYMGAFRYNILFRPMLIPLNRLGVEDQRSICATNGDIMEGGTFYVSHHSEAEMIPLSDIMPPIRRNENLTRLLTATERKEAVITFDTEHFQLRDSSEKTCEQLRWLYWDGMLVCNRLICHTDPGDMLQANIF